MDDEKRARYLERLGIKRMHVGYDLDLETAKNWGLYISKGLRGEPDVLANLDYSN
jgi:hypothetical protein